MCTASTIEHLPAEVLTHIFTHCIPKCPLDDNRGGPTTLERLEEVCMMWKAIMTSTPHIWTTISLAFNYNTTIADFEQVIISTKVFLQRWGRLPLRISLIDRDCSPSLDCAPLIRLLVEHSHRWRYIHFEIPIWSHRLINQSGIQNQLSSLEGVSLFVSNLQGGFQPCPYNLPVGPIGIGTVSPLFPLHHSALPWDQLISWTGNLQAEEILQLLRACTHLRSCSIPSVMGRGFGSPRLATVENNSVSHLTFEVNGNLEQVMSYISLPALSNLTLEGAMREDDIAASSPELHVFLQRIHSLRYLRLREWSSTSSIDLIGLLSLTPEVISLDLEVTRGLTNDLLVGLTPITPGQAHILPKLERLKCSGIIIFSETHLRQFIFSRWAGSHQQSMASSGHMRLRSVQIAYYYESASQLVNTKSQDGEESMEGLKAMGFGISILLEDRLIL